MGLLQTLQAQELAGDKQQQFEFLVDIYLDCHSGIHIDFFADYGEPDGEG